MPQMMPMNWLMIFFSFTLTIYLTITFVYFIPNLKPSPICNNKMFKTTSIKLTW